VTLIRVETKQERHEAKHREVTAMGEFTHGVEAEVNGMNGLTLGVETLEERIAPWVVGDVGVGVGVGIGADLGGGSGCECEEDCE